ncbi:hypothetical protein [Haladaptatus sp. R4]|uniref:hypothetical protein n=1 Tax=Haladaptatus sp. R4 TaxID=1679489 RepID=UPI0012373371|nr:hypothetical protein [Haladaptatus sp. R4]
MSHTHRPATKDGRRRSRRISDGIPDNDAEIAVLAGILVRAVPGVVVPVHPCGRTPACEFDIERRPFHIDM